MDLFPGSADLIERVCSISEKSGVPYCFLGVGAGPIAGESARAIFAKCLAGARSVTVRDQGSLDLCRGLLKCENAVRAPDIAFALQNSRRTNTRRGGLAVNVAAVGDRTWPKPDEEQYRSYVAGIVRLVRAVIGECKPQRVEFVSTNGIVDDRALDDVRLELNRLRSGDTPVATVASCQSVTDVIEAFSRANLAITTRLHAGILAAVAGCRVLPVAYDRKVGAVLQEERIAPHAIELADICDEEWNIRASLNLIDDLPEGPRDTIGAEAIAAVREALALSR